MTQLAERLPRKQCVVCRGVESHLSSSFSFSMEREVFMFVVLPSFDIAGKFGGNYIWRFGLQPLKLNIAGILIWRFAIAKQNFITEFLRADMAEIKFGGAVGDHQTAKLNSPPNFSAIRYVCRSNRSHTCACVADSRRHCALILILSYRLPSSDCRVRDCRSPRQRVAAGGGGRAGGHIAAGGRERELPGRDKGG